MLPSVCLQSVIISAVSFSCFSPLENIVMKLKTSFLYSNWDWIIIIKKNTKDIFVFEFEVRSTLCSDPPLICSFYEPFPRFNKAISTHKRFTKVKKNVCEGHKKCHRGPAVPQQKQLWFVLRLQTWSDSRGNIWMLSQLRFWKKKKERKG